MAVQLLSPLPQKLLLLLSPQWAYWLLKSRYFPSPDSHLLLNFFFSRIGITAVHQAQCPKLSVHESLCSLPKSYVYFSSEKATSNVWALHTEVKLLNRWEEHWLEFAQDCDTKLTIFHKPLTNDGKESTLELPASLQIDSLLFLAEVTEDAGHSGTWSTIISHLEARPNFVLIKQLSNLGEAKDPHDHRSLPGLHPTWTTQSWQSFQLSLATSVKAHPVFTRHLCSHCGQKKEEEALVQLIFYTFATLIQHESTWKGLASVTIYWRQVAQIRGEEEQHTPRSLGQTIRLIKQNMECNTFPK